MNFHSRRSLRIALAILLACAMACARRRDSPPLSVVQTNDITTLDPNREFEVVNDIVAMNIFDPMLRFDRHMTLQPSLAVRWENPNDRTWRLHLRSGVTFHDGTPLSADDVVFTIRRVLAHPESELYPFFAGVVRRVGIARARHRRDRNRAADATPRAAGFRLHPPAETPRDPGRRRVLPPSRRDGPVSIRGLAPGRPRRPRSLRRLLGRAAGDGLGGLSHRGRTGSAVDPRRAGAAGHPARGTAPRVGGTPRQPAFDPDRPSEPLRFVSRHQRHAGSGQSPRGPSRPAGDPPCHRSEETPPPGVRQPRFSRQPVRPPTSSDTTRRWAFLVRSRRRPPSDRRRRTSRRNRRRLDMQSPIEPSFIQSSSPSSRKRRSA